MTIWKYPIPIADTFELSMPDEAETLSVQMQHGRPVLWCLLNPVNTPSARRFRLAGTGHEIPEAVGKHIGTFQLNGGSLVFHLFEL